MLPSTATTIGPRGSREGVGPGAAPRVARPDPEVVARPAQARRRQCTAAYKLRILDEAAHTPLGQVGALLRREGLYSSHLVNWQRQRKQGALAALAPQRRGRPAHSAEARELAQARAENARLARALAAAELVIDVQKKVSALLGLTLPALPDVSAALDLATPGNAAPLPPATSHAASTTRGQRRR
jgi:transposase